MPQTATMVQQFTQFIIDFVNNNQGPLTFLVIAMLAGLFGQMIVPGKGFGMVSTIIIGLISEFVGKQYLIKYITFVENQQLKELIVATVVAVLLTIPSNLIAGSGHKDKTRYRNNA
ncbi:MAG: GlsB/YeaQ/YmgE family stress response membrane protein [Chitinophagia bacterium]|nr:GlsB/YeaQ/YmgE family stress response membrane protein [Chitinophagia bacterium]